MIAGRPWPAFWAAVFALLLQVLAPASAGVVELAPGTGELTLSTHVTYRHDTSGDEPVEDALRLLDTDALAPVPGGNPAFGFQDGAFWVHARVLNRNRKNRAG